MLIVMSGIAVVSSAIGLIEKARSEIREWDKHRTVKEQIGTYLKEDAGKYLQIFENLSSMTPNSVYPLLDEIEDLPTKSQINNFIAISIDSQGLFAQLLNLFVQIAKDCSIICHNEAFMKKLLETNAMLYDFLKQMNSAYQNNGSVIISEDYYGFFRLYRNQLIKIDNKRKTEANIEEAECRLLSIKKTIIPNLSSSIISRENKKKYQHNYELLCKATNKISVKVSIESNLQNYVLPELKPLVVLLNEILLENERKAKLQKKYSLSHTSKVKR
jgi:hypothetical protein